MKKCFLSILLFSVQDACFSQQVFFRSAQAFSKENMESFYSSIAVQGDYVLFNAADYRLYAYKKDGTTAWSSNLGYKGNTPPFIVDDRVWITAYQDRRETVKQFSLLTGSELKETGLANIFTKPIVRDGILYATGIADLGCVFAYDLKADSMLWQRFLAHGCSRTPYYLPDRIIANAEGDHWIDVRYDGKLVKENCEDSTVRFPSELTCAREFDILTHDGREVKKPSSEKWVNECYSNHPSIQHYKQNTFVLHCNQLSVIGNKLKEKVNINLDDLIPEGGSSDGSLSEILAVNDEQITVAYASYIFIYNYRKKLNEQSIDLSAWEPHQVVVDSGKIWLISKKDGLLYGITGK